MPNIRYSTTLVAITCGSCAIPFGLPESMYNKVHADGSSFYCPDELTIPIEGLSDNIGWPAVEKWVERFNVLHS